MTGRSTVHALKQRLDATFSRAQSISISAELELLSDLARYLCILISGFLEQAVIELVMDYARRRSDPKVQNYVWACLRRFTNAKAQKLIDLLGSLDPDWREDLSNYLIDHRKAAVDSIVDLRNAISHGRSVGVTLGRVKDYYQGVVDVVDHIGELCGQ